MPIEVGQTAGDYEILDLLGKGGMGRVYRVRHSISNRVEAMKVLLEDMAAEPELADRFISEIRTLARLDHPNIAKLYTAVKIDNQLVMIMELLEGVTLYERIKQGPIPLNDAIDYTAQTLSALGYAHQHGVIHRDIKPSNVMLSPHGVVKVMDFGIAKSDLETNKTRTGMTMGSMLYMSPEQVRGSQVDERSDLYSVGVMLYEMVVGQRPFEGDNTHAVLNAQLNSLPRPPIEINSALPQTLNDIIMLALAKEPLQRFRTADAFRRALESLLPKPAAAAAAMPQPAAAARSSSRGLWMALGAVVCVAVLAGGAFVLPKYFKSRADSKPAEIASAPAATSSPKPEAPQPVPEQPQPSPPAQVTPAVQPQPAADAKKQSEVFPHKVIMPIRPGANVAAANVAPPVEPPPQPVPSPAAQSVPPSPPVPAGASPEQLEEAQDELIKLRSRADAIRGSVEHLRARQAEQGLNMNPTITATVSRMDNNLAAAERALQNSNIDSVHKYLERAEAEISQLESRFGR